MRDINRIEPFLRKLQTVWEQSPDLRFGQLFSKLARKTEGDMFYVEDNQWEKVLNSLIDTTMVKIRLTKPQDYPDYTGKVKRFKDLTSIEKLHSVGVDADKYNYNDIFIQFSVIAVLWRYLMKSEYEIINE